MISTFCQLLQKPLEHTVVRDALRRKCPEHVDAQNFLEVNAVWRDLLQALGEDPRTLSLFGREIKRVGATVRDLRRYKKGLGP